MGSKKIIIFGTSGAAKQAYYLIKDKKNEYEIIGFAGDKKEKIGQNFLNKKIVCCDDDFFEFASKFFKTGDAILNIALPFGEPRLRKDVYEKIIEAEKKLKSENKNIKFEFPNLIHSSALIDKDLVKLGKGNIVNQGTIFETDGEIGNFNFINQAASIGHDIKIGDFNSIFPNVSIAGNVSLGNDITVGIGATIIPGIEIGDKVYIGAGATVIRNAEEGKVYIGTPAKAKEDKNK